MIALGVGVLAVPTLLQVPAVQAAMVDANVLPGRASYSTLALREATELEDTVRSDGRTAFTFIATNEGDETKSYRWSVSVTPGDKEPDVIRTGDLELAAGQSTEVRVRFRLDHCRARNRITVDLDGPDDRDPSIGYLVLWHGSRAWQNSGGPSCG